MTKITIRDQKSRDKFTEELLKDWEDETLLRDLRGCCNQNCNVINEVVRRYNNKKKECENLEKRITDLGWEVSAYRDSLGD